MTQIILTFAVLISIIAILLFLIINVTTKTPGAEIFTHGFGLLAATFTLFVVILIFHLIFEKPKMEEISEQQIQTEVTTELQ